MRVEKSEQLALATSEDVVRARQVVRGQAIAAGLSLVDQTKVVTAASEIARNTITHGGGGTVLIETLAEPPRVGVRLTFTDRGPGIADIDLALTDGYSTGGGLGLGLSGSRRLSSEFWVESTVGEGTKVVLVRWK